MFKDLSTLHSLFEKQVNETPDKIALVEGDKTITYQELNTISNQFARYLTAQGIQPGDVVALGLNHSIELIVGMLGILKLGGAFLVLDFNWPISRLDFVLSDSNARLLVTDSTKVNKYFINNPVPSALIDKEWSLLSQYEKQNIKQSISSKKTAFILYTSGSTGKPKGVLILHAGIVHRVTWMESLYPYAFDERCCAKSTLGFADAMSEIFTPLCKGITVYLLGSEIVKQVDNFVQLLAVHQITRILLTPSLLNTMLALFPNLPQKLPYLKHWEVSGEAITSALASNFLKIYPSAKLINIHGSSEALDSVCHEITQEDISRFAHMPIGKSVPNSKYYLLDENMSPVATGEKGHIYAGGAGLAGGYLNQPELTEKFFIKNPFDDADRYPVLYNMGDIGSLSAEGVFFYHGRSDHQVKINGKRVELGEIEAALLQYCSGVDMSAVKYWQFKENHGLLVGYITHKPNVLPLSSSEIQQLLSKELPEHMVPAQIVTLPYMPLNINGKIDRSALVMPNIASASNLPTTEFERELLSIFQREIGEEFSITPHIDFTAMGMNSLLIIKIRAIIADKYDIVLSLQQILQADNVKRLSELLLSVKDSPESLKKTEKYRQELDLYHHESSIKKISYADLEKKVQLIQKPFLDDNTRIEYHLFSSEHYTEAIALIGKMFVEQELVCNYLNISAEEFIAVYAEDIKQALQEKLSIVAIKSNQLVGVTIAIDAFNRSFSSSITDPILYEKCRLVSEQLEILYQNKEIIIRESGHTVSQLLTAVHDDFLNYDVSYTLEKLSIFLAIQQNFQKIIAELTSPLSQSLAKELGYKLGRFYSNASYIDSKGMHPLKEVSGGIQLGELDLTLLRKHASPPFSSCMTTQQGLFKPKITHTSNFNPSKRSYFTSTTFQKINYKKIIRRALKLAR